MADISAFQHKFRANGDGPYHETSNKVNKRNRLPVSCLPCRTRKQVLFVSESHKGLSEWCRLKCDKDHPCDSCTKRGDQSSCSYRSDLSTARSKNASNGNTSRAQERLHHLEGLVMQLMQSETLARSAPSSVPTPTNSASADKDFVPLGGLLIAEGSEPSYVGATHWAAILDNIKVLKSDFSPGSSPLEEDDLGDSNRGTSQEDSIFSLISPPSLETILQSLQPRQMVDRRLSVYFNAKYAVIPIIHTHHFQRLYEAFWRDPYHTPVMWIAQLFCMLCLSAQLSQAMGSEPPSPPDLPPMSTTFLASAAQCLVLGQYAKPQRFVVEALCLYAQCKYLATLDPTGEVYILFGIIIRQAFRMGYHRDPKHFPTMSVFEGEMRRRSWAMMRQFDLMNSFQVGLPSNIQSGQYDVALPRNLLDSDFDEWSTELPPSRPETDVDQITYFIVKGRLMTVFEKILNQELSMEPVSHNRVMELDSELRQAHSTVPQALIYRPMSQSFADPSHVIMIRLNAELLYQKSLCVLHRKFLASNNANGYSREVCATAAMEILDHQADLHQESQPGGQLYQHRWMLSSFTLNDFFLAAMVLCLDVSTNHRSESEDHPDTLRKAKIDKLQCSYLICNEQKLNSKEARRVTEALGAMLAKLGVSASKPPPTNNPILADNAFPTPPFSMSSTTTASDQMNGFTVGPDTLQNFMSVPENFDWAFLDQYLLDPSATGNIDPNWPDPALLGYLETRPGASTGP